MSNRRQSIATQVYMLDQTEKKEDIKSDVEAASATGMEPMMMVPDDVDGSKPSGRFREKNNPIDAKKYDYRSNRTTLTPPNNVIESIAHMLMYGLGGGLVVLHAAYMECGIFLAVGINVFLAALVGYCTCLLIWSAQKLYGRVQKTVLTYPDIIEAAILLSPWKKFRKTARGARYILEGTLMMHLYGICCVFIIMIARALKELVTGDHTIRDAGEPPLKVYIISLVVPCLVISMVIDLKIIAPFALVCNFYAFAIIIVLIWYSFDNMVDSPLDRAPYKSVMGGFEFLGVCIFVLEPISYSLSVENNMQDPSKFHYVILGSVPIHTACMVAVGFFGYWHYAENCVSPITIHFPYSAFAVILKVFLCITLYVVYAMCFHVAFDVEWFYLKRYHQTNFWFWERLYRAVHVVVLILISYQLPNVTRIMGVLGGLFTTPAIIIYPAIIELILDWEYPGLGRHKWRLWKCIAIVFLGFVALFGGTYYNILGMVEEVEIQTRGDFKPNYTHKDEDDKWINRILRIGTDIHPYNKSDRNAYDTMYANSTKAIQDFNNSTILPYNQNDELTKPITVDLNNSALYLMPEQKTYVDSSTAVLSNGAIQFVMPRIENTSVIVTNQNIIVDETTVGVSINNIIVSKQNDVKNTVTESDIDRKFSNETFNNAFVDNIPTENAIDKELSNDTFNNATVVKKDAFLTDVTDMIGGNINKASNQGKIGKELSNDTFNNATVVEKDTFVTDTNNLIDGNIDKASNQGKIDRKLSNDTFINASIVENDTFVTPDHHDISI